MWKYKAATVRKWKSDAENPTRNRWKQKPLRHKVALIAESNLKIDLPFLRRKEWYAECRLICRRREVGSDVLFMETMADNR